MKIIIADDHQLLLETLSAYLEKALIGIEIDCVSGLEELQQRLDSDVLYELMIVDFRMPGSQGLKTVRSLVNNRHGVPMVVMSGAASQSEAIEMLNMGIVGYLPKTTSGNTMAHAVRLVLSGERYIPGTLFSGLSTTGSGAGGSRSPDAKQLTDKEMQVLRLLRLGYTNKEIGREIGIEEVTVKVYISRLTKRFGVTNRVQLLVASIEQGVID